MSVGNFDVQLSGAFDNFFTLSDRDVVGDFSAVLAVVHHEKVQVIDVVDVEFEEAVGKNELGVLVTSVTDLDLLNLRFLSFADARVDTSGFSPRGVSDANKLLALVTTELEGSLFDDLMFDKSGLNSRLRT